MVDREDDWPASVGDLGEEDLDAELIRRALDQLPLREQLLLKRLYIHGERESDVAELLALSPEEFADLVIDARRQLRQHYDRLRDTGLAVVPMMLVRRTAAVIRRVGEGVAEQWARLGNHAVEVIASSVVATLAVVAGLSVGVSIVGDKSPSGRTSTTAPDGQVPANRVVVPEPTSVRSVPAERPITARRNGRAVGPSVGYLRPPTPRTSDETVYGFDSTTPIVTPEETDDQVSSEPVNLGIGAGFHCPSPEERSVLLTVLCTANGEG